MIQFLLNDEPVMVQQERADVTVLQWLREHREKRGTKEGCASGDCGACTVVVASLTRRNEKIGLHYASINSCITFLGALHSKQLITVEDLADGKKLHPVQQAMVDEHGAQCGFCTPGFIMSMFALYHSHDWSAILQDEQKLNHRVDQALGGNLCRCTGYAPIKRAAISALRQHKTDAFDDKAENTIQALKALRQKISMHPRFLIPHTAEELGAMRIQYPKAKLLAGGTDLGLEVTQQHASIDTIVYIKQVPELLGVSVDNGVLSIGSAVSLTRCLKVMKKHYPSTEPLMLRFASEQIRNEGTIGGNIVNASPVGDLPPLLLALDATLALQCGETVRHAPINDFYKAYKQIDLADNEFLRQIRLPLLTQDTHLFVHKVSKRLDDDISAVCGVFWLKMDANKIVDVRIAFGGMAATSARAALTEDCLRGQEFDEVRCAKAMDEIKRDFSPISDARASEDYRQTVAQNLLKRCFLALQTDHETLHVSDYVSV